MARDNELFYPLLPANIGSMDDSALLRYIAKSDKFFRTNPDLPDKFSWMRGKGF